MGQALYAANGQFTIPKDITQVSLCMCGGGGGGESDNNSNAYGGFAGEKVSRTITVTPADVVDITIGVGGVGSSGGSGAGQPGTESSFGLTIAKGGQNPTNPFSGSGHAGNGGFSPESCGGLHKDGLRYGDGYGGEAGLFGDGGNKTGDGQAGEIGAGGGGNDGSSAGGTGGRGQVVVNWDDPSSQRPEFRINGTVVDNETGTMMVMGISCNTIMQDGQEVWSNLYKAPRKFIGEGQSTEPGGTVSKIIASAFGSSFTFDGDAFTDIEGRIEFEPSGNLKVGSKCSGVNGGITYSLEVFEIDNIGTYTSETPEDATRVTYSTLDGTFSGATSVGITNLLSVDVNGALAYQLDDSYVIDTYMTTEVYVQP